MTHIAILQAMLLTELNNANTGFINTDCDNLRPAIKILCSWTTTSPARGVEWEGISKQTNKRVHKSANAVYCNTNPPDELSLGEKNLCSVSTIFCFIFLL